MVIELFLLAVCAKKVGRVQLCTAVEWVKCRSSDPNVENCRFARSSGSSAVIADLSLNCR